MHLSTFLVICPKVLLNSTPTILSLYLNWSWRCCT